MDYVQFIKNEHTFYKSKISRICIISFNSNYSSILQSISPGAVKTDIFFKEQMDFMEANNVPFLNSEDISQAILYAIGTPPHVQVNYSINIQQSSEYCFS